MNNTCPPPKNKSGCCILPIDRIKDTHQWKEKDKTKLQWENQNNVCDGNVSLTPSEVVLSLISESFISICG